MSEAIAAIARSSLLLGAALGLRGLLVRRSAAVRHAVLASGIACATLVVPASFVLPAWSVSLPAPSASRAGEALSHDGLPGGAPVISMRAPAEERQPLPWPQMVWLAGVVVAGGSVAAGLLRLTRIAARARPFDDDAWARETAAIAAMCGLRRRVVLLEAPAPFVLATWGWHPARILLPREARLWEIDRIRLVLAHELAHVARADWPIQICAQLFAAVLWFNPLAWIVCRLMRRDSESACDDAVLACGIGAADYAAHVVALAREWRRPRWPPVPALFIAHPSAFERRVAAMLNSGIDRRPLSGRTAATVAAALFAVTIGAASIRAAQAPPAALSGTVYDPTGAVMPGVAITLEDPQQHTVQATTDAAGRFSFPGIGSGQYVLSAEIPGFRKLHDEFALKTAADWDRALTMPLGTLQESINVRAARTTPEPAPTRPMPIRVGGNIRAPRKTLDVKPMYPASMRTAGREGQVRLDATIGPDGSVTSVRVVGGQVHPDFAIAAADAVRQWQFTPTLLNGRPVEVVMTVTVTFSLSD